MQSHVSCRNLVVDNEPSSWGGGGGGGGGE